MELELTNCTNSFNSMIDQFILNKKIKVEKLDCIDECLEIVQDYKKHFAESNLKSVEIIKIFSGLTLFENFFKSAKERLIAAKKRGENPTTAEEINEFKNNLIEISNEIDTYKLQQKKDLPNSIDNQCLELREKLRTKKLYPEIQELKLKGNEKKIEKIFYAKLIEHA